MSMRRKLGLDLDKPVALLMGGGDGMGRLDVTAKCVAKRLYSDWGADCAQLVIVCGRNAAVQASLEKEKWPIPVKCRGELLFPH